MLLPNAWRGIHIPLQLVPVEVGCMLKKSSHKREAVTLLMRNNGPETRELQERRLTVAVSRWMPTILHGLPAV